MNALVIKNLHTKHERILNFLKCTSILVYLLQVQNHKNLQLAQCLKNAPKSAVLGKRKIQIVYLIILWRIFQLSNFVRSNSWENYEGEDYILRLRRSRSRCRAGHCSHDSLPLLNSRVRSSKICYFMHFPYLLITRQQSSSSLCLGLVFYWDFLLFSSCRRPLQSSILK